MSSRCSKRAEQALCGVTGVQNEKMDSNILFINSKVFRGFKSKPKGAEKNTDSTRPFPRTTPSLLVWRVLTNVLTSIAVLRAPYRAEDPKYLCRSKMELQESQCRRMGASCWKKGKDPTPKTRVSIWTLLRTPGRFTTRPLRVYFTTKMSVVRPFSVLSKELALSKTGCFLSQAEILGVGVFSPLPIMLVV